MAGMGLSDLLPLLHMIPALSVGLRSDTSSFEQPLNWLTSLQKKSVYPVGRSLAPKQELVQNAASSAEH